MLGEVARWLIVVGSVAIVVLAVVYRREIWQALAAGLPALGALGLGLRRQARAVRAVSAALWTPPPLPQNSAANEAAPTREKPMDIRTLLADAAGAIKAALPPEAGADALKLFDDGLEAVQAVADHEIEAALHALPPALAPFAPQIQAMAENALAAAEAEAAKWAALKAALAETTTHKA